MFAKDGSLYFTDPPYGLLKQDDDPGKEIRFNGVYRFADGRVQALVRDLNRPNGLAFSPDFKWLYVNNSDPGEEPRHALRRRRGRHALGQGGCLPTSRARLTGSRTG